MDEVLESILNDISGINIKLNGLSTDLIGPAGEKGDTGEQGPAGADGSDGSNGLSVTDISAVAQGDGRTIITITKETVAGGATVDVSFVINDGVDGADGADGANGTGGSAAVNTAGQTYLELITQQPASFGTITSSNSSSYIDLSWSLDDLYPTIDGELHHKSSTSKRLLPEINYIAVDVSAGSVTSGWVRAATINQYANSSDESRTSYDTSYRLNKPTSASNTLNSILLNSSGFDLRVYGINEGVDYPSVENRTTVKTGVSFQEANGPSQPTIVSFGTTDTQEIPIVINVAQAEDGNPSTAFQLDDANISAALVTSKRQGGAVTGGSTVTQTVNLTNTSSNQTITLDDSTLTPGTTYNVQVRATNTDGQVSSYSTASATPYTAIPGSNGVDSSFSAALSNSTSTFFSSGGAVSGARYINVGDSGALTWSSASKVVELSQASATANSTSGFGTYINGSTDLVTLTATYGSKTQSLAFGGWGVSDSNTNNGLGVFSGVSSSDIYSSEPNSGFRRKAAFSLTTLGSSVLDASPSQQTISFNYSNSLNSGSNSTPSVSFYVDNLSGAPSGGTISVGTPTVVSSAYCCGVESVKTFNVDITINDISNVHSSNKFLYAGGKIASLQFTGTNIVGDPTQNVTVGTSELSSDGSYTGKTVSFNGISFQKTYNGETNITYSKRLYSLVSTPASSGSLAFSGLYCDYASFNKSGNVITTTNCPAFYELSEALSNPQNISATAYSDHTTQLESWTMTYTNGKFQTNGSTGKWIVFDSAQADSKFNSTPDYKFVYYVDGSTIRIGDMTAEFDSSNHWNGNIPTTLSSIRGALNGSTVVIPSGVTTEKYVYGFN